MEEEVKGLRILSCGNWLSVGHLEVDEWSLMNNRDGLWYKLRGIIACLDNIIDNQPKR